MASTRRSRENHWRILERAFGVCTNSSQSRLGPASATLLVKISTVFARVQRIVEWHQTPVDPGPDASMTHLGVHRVPRSRPPVAPVGSVMILPSV